MAVLSVNPINVSIFLIKFHKAQHNVYELQIKHILSLYGRVMSISRTQENINGVVCGTGEREI